MRNLVLIALILSSTNAYSNCELLSSGFHTIATYLEKDSFKNDSKYPINYQISNNNIQVNLDQIGVSLNNFKIKSMDYDRKICEVKNTNLEFPFRMQTPFINIPLCFSNFISSNERPILKALYDKSNGKIELPKLAKLIKADSIPKERLDSIEYNIKEYLKDKLFRATIGYDLNPNEYEIKGMDHYNYEATNTVMTMVKADSYNRITKAPYKFEIVFMSLGKTSWYIADSSFIHPCTRESVSGQKEYEESLKYEKEYPSSKPDYPPHASAEDMGNIKSSGVELFSYGWIYGNEDYPQIIEFDVDYVKNSYYIDYQKRMIVLHESTYRNIMTNNPTLGIQPAKTEHEKK